ncbi:MAG TPA: DUF58 domain-containing protein [Actinomycetota bacterium]
MPRRRAAAMVVGAGLLFVVGTSVQAGWLLVLASILLGAALVGLLLPRRMVRGLQVERRSPSEASQGDDVLVEVIVANRGRGVKLGLEVEDTHVANARVSVPPLAPGERVVIGTVRRAARRGLQEDTPVRIRSAAPFGVAESRRRLEVPGRTLVLPALVRLPSTPLVDASPTPEHAIHSAPRRGTGPEYLGIREYRVGDSMRHVHWPSTARHGQVMVREFEQEHTRRLAIVVDTLADAGEEETPLDTACSVAASVAFSALGRGHGVRLLAAREGSVDALMRAEPPHLLEWLAELPAFGGLALAQMLPELGARLRGVQTVLLAVPTWRANAGLPDAVAAVQAVAPRVAAALIEAHGFPADRRAPVMSEREADRLAEGLLARGVAVYRVRAKEDLAACLARPTVLAS